MYALEKSVTRAAVHVGAAAFLFSTLGYADTSIEILKKKADAIVIPEINLPVSELNKDPEIPNEAEFRKKIGEATQLVIEAKALGLKADMTKFGEPGAGLTRRDAHPFAMGCVFGEYEALPNVADQGLNTTKVSQPGSKFPVVARFSNGSQRKDYLPDGRGMALKIILPDATQDVLMINFPAFFVKDQNYGEFAKLEVGGQGADYLKKPQHFYPEAYNALNTAVQWVPNMAAIQYWTMTPYFFGDRLAKISAKPIPCEGSPEGELRLVNQDVAFLRELKAAYELNAAALAELRPIERALEIAREFAPGDVDDLLKELAAKFVKIDPVQSFKKFKAEELKPFEHYLRDGLQTQLDPKKGAPVCFHLMVQFQNDPKRQFVNNSTVAWKKSPFIPFAKITFSPQAFTSDQALAWCETRHYTPEHRAAFKEAGLLNKLRVDAYAQSFAFRTERNKKLGKEVDTREPKGDEWKQWQ